MNTVEQFACYPSPFGWIKMTYNAEGIVEIERIENMVSCEGAQPSPLSERAFSQILEYMEGRRKAFDFPYVMQGTSFQQSVWCALLEIPYGETRSYLDIAKRIGKPKAARAVGMANHKNPLMLLVPCHRVIGSDGSLTGYAGGLDMKAALLEMERAYSAY